MMLWTYFSNVSTRCSRHPHSHPEADYSISLKNWQDKFLLLSTIIIEDLSYWSSWDLSLKAMIPLKNNYENPGIQWYNVSPELRKYPLISTLWLFPENITNYPYSQSFLFKVLSHSVHLIWTHLWFFENTSHAHSAVKFLYMRRVRSLSNAYTIHQLNNLKWFWWGRVGGEGFCGLQVHGNNSRDLHYTSFSYFSIVLHNNTLQVLMHIVCVLSDVII